ncbi:MAG: molybdopterin-binding protein [Acidobacteria bacterium]|nr:molybdopterin-binding protein [Acidobacteriota bacterium]
MRVPQASLIAIGDELVSARRPEANGPAIVPWLEALGCEIRARLLVPDRAEAIEAAVAAALSGGSELIVLSGGLGPTHDDVAREAIAAALRRPLVLDPAAQAAIESRFRERGLEVPPEVARLALRPEGSELVPNPVGMAPGFLVRQAGATVIALPGVPREFETMFERKLLPELRRSLVGALARRSETLHVVGLNEAEVDRRVADAIETGSRLSVSFVSQRSEVEVLVTARAETEAEAARALERANARLEEALGAVVYGRGDDTLVGVVGRLLGGRGWTLATAESLSGGLLAKRITDQPDRPVDRPAGRTRDSGGRDRDRRPHPASRPVGHRARRLAADRAAVLEHLRWDVEQRPLEIVVIGRDTAPEET